MDSFPNWVEINFRSAKTIDEIAVFTCQDNYANPTELTETMHFTLYRLTGYRIQY